MQNNFILNACKAPDTLKMIVLGIAFTTWSMSPQTFMATPFMKNMLPSLGWGPLPMCLGCHKNQSIWEIMWKSHENHTNVTKMFPDMQTNSDTFYFWAQFWLEYPHMYPHIGVYILYYIKYNTLYALYHI